MTSMRETGFFDQLTGFWAETDFVPPGTCFGGDGGDTGGSGGSSLAGGGDDRSASSAPQPSPSRPDDLTSAPSSKPDNGSDDPPQPSPPRPGDLASAPTSNPDNGSEDPPQPSPSRPDDLTSKPPEPSPPRPEELSSEPPSPSPARPDDLASAPPKPEPPAAAPPEPSSKDLASDTPIPSPPTPQDVPDGQSPPPTPSEQTGEAAAKDVVALGSTTASTVGLAATKFADITPDLSAPAKTVVGGIGSRLGVIGNALDAGVLVENVISAEPDEQLEVLAREGPRLAGKTIGTNTGAVVGGLLTAPSANPAVVVGGALTGGAVGGYLGEKIGGFIADTALDNSSDEDTNASGDTTLFPPIVLDLDGDGIEIVGLTSSSTLFDVDGDAVLERTGWAGPDDGLLAIDLGGDGIINRPEEIAFALSDPAAQTDLEGLSLAFDSNDDGVFDAGDQRFDEFRVWQDQDQDGVSDPGELKTLEELEIASLDLSGVAQRDGPTAVAETRDGNQIFGRTSFRRTDGSEGIAADVAFLTEDSPGASLAPTGRSTDARDEGRPGASRLLDDDVSYEELWSQPEGANAVGQTATAQSAVAGYDGPAASLVNNQLDQLVSAMSSFDPPSSDAATDYEDRSQKPTEPTLAENLQS